ncbi:MAG: hypothetical protein ONB16_02275 [candidate division KSB1 bacterium]|nr:hypothetical protein [candidate division KSB1 bacterium]MDZ7341521.1 hypothetical protein [candidate division KSB1 bacterium]
MIERDIQPMLISLAQAIRRRIYPYLGTAAAREVEGVAHSGDVTFQVDVLAEREIADFFARHPFDVAYYTEDRGMVLPAKSPTGLLIIDPIDGTRPAFSGFESAAVSIAYCSFHDRATFKDISHAVVLELKTGNLFYAAAHQGVLIQSSDPFLKVNLSSNQHLERLRWCFEIVGRPASQILGELAGLIDQSSYKGGVYIFNCSAFALTRIVSGQLDAYVEISGRMAKAVAQHQPDPQLTNHQPTFGLFAYDIAAAYLIAKEAGCVLSDDCGHSLDNTLLADNTILSCVAASNPMLHQQLIAWLNR